jgi:hypothetical protein
MPWRFFPTPFMGPCLYPFGVIEGQGVVSLTMDPQSQSPMGDGGCATFTRLQRLVIGVAVAAGAVPILVVGMVAVWRAVSSGWRPQVPTLGGIVVTLGMAAFVTVLAKSRRRFANEPRRVMWPFPDPASPIILRRQTRTGDIELPRSKVTIPATLMPRLQGLSGTPGNRVLSLRTGQLFLAYRGPSGWVRRLVIECGATWIERDGAAIARQLGIPYDLQVLPGELRAPVISLPYFASPYKYVDAANEGAPPASYPSCPTCGYSLFGLRRVKCPECGWSPRPRRK